MLEVFCGTGSMLTSNLPIHKLFAIHFPSQHGFIVFNDDDTPERSFSVFRLDDKYAT
jgi:hypothetical protein